MPEPEDLFRAGEQTFRSARLLLEARMWADAISRAYYAMVYAARALLLTQGMAPRTHRGVAQVFGREFVVPGLFPVDLAKLLTATMAFRDRADYGPREDLTEDDARRAVEGAERFLEAAKGVLRRGP